MQHITQIIPRTIDSYQPDQASGCGVTFCTGDYDAPASSRWWRTLQGFRQGCVGFTSGTVVAGGSATAGSAEHGAGGVVSAGGTLGGDAARRSVRRCCRFTTRLRRCSRSIIVQRSSYRSLQTAITVVCCMARNMHHRAAHRITRRRNAPGRRGIPSVQGRRGHRQPPSVGARGRHARHGSASATMLRGTPPAPIPASPPAAGHTPTRRPRPPARLRASA